MGRVNGKVAIVTGAARGLGSAIASRLVAEGAHVIMTDVLEHEGHRRAAELGEQAHFLRHDVTSADDWGNVVRTAQECFGPVSVLVNNAGVLGPVSGIEQLSETDYRKVNDVNQIGTFLAMKTVVESMRRAGGGC